MIEMGKTYRTRDGREVRIYATDGAGGYPVHGALRAADGWIITDWGADGRNVTSCSDHCCDLIPSDPHGILPRHRELLASAYEEMSGHQTFFNGKVIRESSFEGLSDPFQAALIALAKLDNERGGE